MPLLPNNLGKLDIVEVFEEHDFPCLFVCESDSGLQYLALWIAEAGDRNDWLYTEISPARLQALRTGEVKLREAYTESESGKVLRVSVPKSAGDATAKPLAAADLTKEMLPTPTATLVGEVATPERPLRSTAEIDIQISSLPKAIADAMGLFQELKVSRFVESDSDGQIAFDGGPVAGHEVEARFYGMFWDRFQGLLDAAANEMFGGLTNSSEAKLLLGMTSPSSYAVNMRMKPLTADEFGPMFQSPARDEGRSRELFDFVASMLVDEDKPAATIHFINRFQSVRTQYGSILELMSNSAADITFRTKSNPIGRSLTHASAGKQLKAVRELGYPYGFLQLRGRLVGGLVRKVKNTDTNFTLIVSDTEVFQGKVGDQALAKMREIPLDAEVNAKIQIEDAKAGGQTYTLVDLINVGPQSSRRE
ncbi:MAG: hypothetical protein JWN40_3829 [Phycisphaerales bacterium]|nr:hypothetical protein [Phycisphaerales bacterium]